MKHTLILLAFIVSGCGVVNAQALTTDTEYRTPQPTATQSPVPTATIEYKATANAAETQAYIAQATADEANRVMVQATNDQQQREHETAMQNAQGTQQAQSNAMVQYGWTATAALTTVPLTATAQVDNMTAIANYKAVTIAEITATAHAPTQTVADANAKTQAQLAPAFALAQLFALFAIGFFAVFAVLFMRWYWMREDARAELESRANSPESIAARNGLMPIPENFIMPNAPIEPRPAPRVERPMTAENLKYTIPSAQEQFDIFAEKLVTGEMALSINRWETSGLISGVKNVRAWIKNMRGWMHANGFGVFNENDEMTLVQAGREWLEHYLEKRILPTEYQFGEAAQ